MKLNKNFLTVIFSINSIILAVLLVVLILLMAFYPKASAIHMIVGSALILVINALLGLKDKNQETILNEINQRIEKIGGELPDTDDTTGGV